MPEEPPKIIMIDQVAAMSKAIVVTLPTTFHRYCIWHILNKFMEKPDIGECFSEMCICLWGMDTKEEFDAKWDEIITNNGLKDHPWLSSIHALPESWVPSYVKHVFSAGMSSSQWAESCHSFFKQYINRKNTLMEFIVCFERALGSQRQKELMVDHVDSNEKPPLPFRTPMQHQIAHIYTRAILEMFEREDFRSLLCLFELVEQDEDHCKYKVSEWVSTGVTLMKELAHDKDAGKAYCSCKGFEFWGILCRHILAFLRMKQVEDLPDKYILKRWLQSAKCGVVYDKNDNCFDGLLLVKRSKLCKVEGGLIDSVLLCDEGFELLENSFEDIRGKLTRLVSSRAHVVEEPNGEVETSSPQLRMKYPHRVKAKGLVKRVKGQKEKAAE